MATAASDLVHVKIELELEPSLGRFCAADGSKARKLRSNLLGYVNGLLLDLGIPASASLVMGVGDEKTDWSLNSFRIWIDGNSCRLRIPTKLSQRAQAAELRWSVAEAIYRNRELLLTLDLCARTREMWAAEDGATRVSSLSPEAFRELLVKLVCRNFSVDRARDLTPTECSLDDLFEDGLSCEAAISVFVSAAQSAAGPVERLQSPADDMPFEEIAELMRDGLFTELGLILPKVTCRRDDTLRDGEFRIKLNDAGLPAFVGLRQNEALVNCSDEELSRIKLKGKRAVNPANGKECALVQGGKDVVQLCRGQNWGTWGTASFIVRWLSAEVRKQAGAFLNCEVVQWQLSLLREVLPALVEDLLRRFDVSTLTRILRDLLDEQVPIKDYRTILEGLLAIDGTIDVDESRYVVFYPQTANLCPVTKGKTVDELGIENYADFARISLKRHISSRCSDAAKNIFAFVLDPEVMMRLERSADERLTNDERDRLVKAILKAITNSPPTPVAPVLWTTLEVRRTLRRLVQKEFPNLTVVSQQMISRDRKFNQMALVSWD